jgi:hypothetical protein
MAHDCAWQQIDVRLDTDVCLGKVSLRWCLRGFGSIQAVMQLGVEAFLRAALEQFAEIEADLTD